MDVGFIMVAMLVLGGVMVWAFFTFSPEYIDKKTVKAFNYAVIFIITLFCLTFSIKAYAYIEGSRFMDFLPILLFLANIMIAALGLLVGFIVRNYFIFKSGRGLF